MLLTKYTRDKMHRVHQPEPSVGVVVQVTKCFKLFNRKTKFSNKGDVLLFYNRRNCHIHLLHYVLT